MTGTYIMYPYLESYVIKEPVLSRLLPKIGTHYLVTYSYQAGFPHYPR